MTDEEPAVIIQSFSVRPDEYLEITYIETREQAKRAGIVRSVVIDPDLLRKEDLADVMDSIGDFIDIGLRHIRTGDAPEA